MTHQLPWPQPWPKEGTKGQPCPVCQRTTVWQTFTYVCHPCRLSLEDAQAIAEADDTP